MSADGSPDDYEIATLFKAFPAELRADAEAAIKELQLSIWYSSACFSVQVGKESILIPSRVHPARQPDLSRLTSQQGQLAYCMLTRSTDGFVRQAALRRIMPINAPWSIPFVVALIGEYVVEIIDDIYAGLPQLNRALIASFLNENPAYYKLTRARVVSYWNCYYRSKFVRDEYVGFKLLRELDALQSELST